MCEEKELRKFGKVSLATLTYMGIFACFSTLYKFCYYFFMKRNLKLLLFTPIFLVGCTISQQAMNYSNSAGSKSDMQICIDNAILGANQEFYMVTKAEIDRRELDCSIYENQIASARASAQAAQTTAGFMAVMIGIVAGLGAAAGG